MFVDWLLNGLWTSQPMGISPLSTTGQQLHADCLKVSHFEEKKIPKERNLIGDEEDFFENAQTTALFLTICFIVM